MGKLEHTTLDDWQWVIGVNLWGVIHGINVFLPHLIKNPDGAHIVNTASTAGLHAYPLVGAYTATKFGVMGLSESLAIELAQDHPKVGVSILCPGPVRTNIYWSQRNRPANLAAGGFRDIAHSSNIRDLKVTAKPMLPSEVGKLVADSIQDGRLYAITHPDMFGPIEARHTAIAAAHGR
jgi:NAD(P)-dependent dehydrogenase (short-subunit alcohol dehydrogenase family)